MGSIYIILCYMEFKFIKKTMHYNISYTKRKNKFAIAQGVHKTGYSKKPGFGLTELYSFQENDFWLCIFEEPG